MLAQHVLATSASTSLAFIDGIAFDPFFRGLLSVLVGVVVLVGGTYLLLATNTGARTGFMISAAGFFGWMAAMGMFWVVYGIGWNGAAPTWELVEINIDDSDQSDDGLLFSEVERAQGLASVDLETVLAASPVVEMDLDEFAGITNLEAFAEPRGLDLDVLDEAGVLEVTADDIAADSDLAQVVAIYLSRREDLNDWRYLATSDSIRGQAQASADQLLVEEHIFDSSAEYLALPYGAFTVGGKPVLKDSPTIIDRTGHFFTETFLNPTHSEELLVIQVKQIQAKPTFPGQAPPRAEIDPDAPLISVVMEKDRGGPFPALISGLRWTPLMFTVANSLLFFALAWNLHTRDRREEEVRAAVA